MLPQHLAILVLGFLAGADAGDVPPSSSLGLGTKAQVKNVLDHTPLKQASCQQFVRPTVSVLFASHLPLAERANRNDLVRL